MDNSQTQIEKSIFAVIKFSYNTPGETPVTGGVCGSAFLIDDSTAVTANHVLNSQNYVPNQGFNLVQYWLLSRDNNLIIPLSVDYLESIEGIDTTFIKLPERVECTTEIAKLSPSVNDSTNNYGHVSNEPIMNAHWNNNTLVIDGYNLINCISDRVGTITSIQKAKVNANDIKLDGVNLIQPSFGGNSGMSGGPLMSNDKIIGMMSFGLPADVDIKDTVYAISIKEIIDKLN